MKNDERDISPWRDGFLFVGNDVALDFLNTRPIMEGGPVELLPDFDALLSWFQAAGLLGRPAVADLRKKWGATGAATAAVRRLHEWRERLRKIIVAWEEGNTLLASEVEELNRLLADYPLLTRLGSHGGKLHADPWFATGSPDALFAPLAHSAAMLFTGADRSRIRMCDNCVLHFLDTSKKGTRRWCSMELCGNRLKVAAYAARQRRAKLQKPRP